MKEEKDLYKLTSIDADGGHIHIIPAEVKGFFRKYRTYTHILLLSIFLGLPWIHFQGKQLILLSIPTREFIFFGLTFKSHDAPLIFLLISIGILSLALVTALWGRIWCGWACPQTVFIDFVYRRIERWVEGTYLERRRLHEAEWSWNKFRKIITKWFLFTFFSTLFAHSFVAYFTGSRELLRMMSGTPAENWTYFLIILSFTLLLLFNFGWFREQFCVIMCPYGRIQSVLLEPSSISVMYDQVRGEPRRSPSTPKEATGDCVSCNRCVEVCPTGIDIRNGLQMECISCTACIDACNEIMEKVHKPKGLISYRTLDNSSFKFFKLKTIFYGVLIILAFSVLIYNLNTRSTVDIALLRGIGTPYSQDLDPDGRPQIINHFRLHLNSQTNKEMIFEISLSEKDLQKGLALMVSPQPIVLKPQASETWHLFFHLPKELLPSNGKFDFIITLKSQDGEIQTKNITFLGPAK